LIEINLAPGAQAKRHTRRNQSQLSLPSLPSLGGDARVIGGAVLGMLAVLTIGWLLWSQAQRQSTLETRIRQEVSDSTRFATTIALVTSLRAQQDTVRQQIDVIREVDQRRYVWPHLLEEISMALPAFTWLTEIRSAPIVRDTTGAAPPGPSITLQGNAGSTQALTRFMNNLESSHFIRGVTLVTAQQVDVEGRTLHRFALEARYEPPPASVIETVPVVVVE
jgi:Tfp pilus assembly protein PilN